MEGKCQGQSKQKGITYRKVIFRLTTGFSTPQWKPEKRCIMSSKD